MDSESYKFGNKENFKLLITLSKNIALRLKNIKTIHISNNVDYKNYNLIPAFHYINQS